MADAYKFYHQKETNGGTMTSNYSDFLALLTTLRSLRSPQKHSFQKKKGELHSQRGSWIIMLNRYKDNLTSLGVWCVFHSMKLC